MRAFDVKFKRKVIREYFLAKEDTKSSPLSLTSLTAWLGDGSVHISITAVPALFVSAVDTRVSSSWKCCTASRLKTGPAANWRLCTISAIRIASRCGSNSMSAENFVRRSVIPHWIIRCQQRRRPRLGRQSLSGQSRQTAYCARINGCARRSRT